MSTEQKKSDRVFIGVKITDEVRELFTELERGLAELPVRLVHPQNMHLTLVPPWDTIDRASTEEVLKGTLRGVRRCEVRFERVEYGPTAQRPRLVWVTGAPSQELTKLKKILVDTFGARDEHPSFIPHVTIARFSEKDGSFWRRHPVEQEIVCSMPVNSVELFLSPAEGGGNYEVLVSIPLS